MAKSLHALHSIACLSLHSGGTARVAVEFTDALARRGAIDVTLLSQAARGEEPLSSNCGLVSRVIAESASRIALKAGLPLKSALRRLNSQRAIDLVHSHGLWLPVNHWASQVARRKCIPLIVQPHGMLEPWALNHKAWKKRIAMALFQRRDLEIAQVIVATAITEYESVRKLGLLQPVAVIPNGANFAMNRAANLPCASRDTDNRTVLFLSRVHPKKGLLNLIHAWARLAPLGWRLRIAGPDEGGHLRDIMGLAQKLKINNSVEYIGEVDGERKLSEYRCAHLFVLPTHSENFGVVVAEALAHGLPVITTRGTPWADLETYGCGWWIDIGVQPLVQALREAMALSDDERKEMGVRGQEYVQRYDWDAIALQTMEVYRWALGKGTKPDCVRTD